MSGSGWKDWQIGEVVEAADFQTYVQDQVVQTYSSEAARGSAVGTATTGMVSYVDGQGLEYAVNDGLGERWENIHTGGRNYIINGAFDIWQRGTSFTSPSFNAYTSDRWRNNNYNVAPTTYSVTQQTFTPAELNAIGYGDARFYYRSTLTTIGSNTEYDTCFQRIEDVRTLAGQTVTLSFWAKSDTTRTTRATCEQVFDSVSGSSTGLSFTNGTFTSTSSWQRFSFTFTMPSVSGKTIGASSYTMIGFRQASASGSVLDIWGVQLEAGSVATPFRRHAPSLQGELAACQRYYWEFDTANTQTVAIGYSFSTTAVRGYFNCPVTMRAEPTLTFTGTFQAKVAGGSYDVTSLANIEIGPAQVFYIGTISGTMSANYPVAIITPNKITASAEL